LFFSAPQLKRDSLGGRSLDTGQQALLFFYGVFWATVIAATSPYRAFATALALSASHRSERRNAQKRLFVGFVLLNALPAFVLFILYKCVVPAQSTPRAVVAAAVASLSVFGIHRVFHALVCSKETWHWFYTEGELARYNLGDEEKSGSPWWAHLLPGFGYLFGMPFLASLIV